MMLQVFGSEEARKNFIDNEPIPYFNFVSHEQGMDRFFDGFEVHVPFFGMLVNLDVDPGAGRYVILALDECGVCIEHREYVNYESMLEDFVSFRC